MIIKIILVTMMRLLTTIEEDGVAKEDFFSFDFLDDA